MKWIQGCRYRPSFIYGSFKKRQLGRMGWCRSLTSDSLQYFSNVINYVMCERICIICSPHWFTLKNPCRWYSLLSGQMRKGTAIVLLLHNIMLKNPTGHKALFYSVHLYIEEITVECISHFIRDKLSLTRVSCWWHFKCQLVRELLRKKAYREKGVSRIHCMWSMRCIYSHGGKRGHISVCYCI